MAGKRIRYPDFPILCRINKEVVSLTEESYDYTDEDERRLKLLLKEVRSRGRNEEFKGAMTEKVSLLMFRIATGQHFREGNKRTALVAGSAFLKMNGFQIDMKNSELVSVIDKAGIATATLNDVFSIVEKLVGNVEQGA